MNFIILDTETTGFDQNDRIIQLAYIVYDGMNLEPFETFCSTSQPIGFSAMAVHHITPEMIAGKPKLVDTEIYKFLEELNTEENYIVIHNAPFDLKMLEREGFQNKMKVIDTLRVTQRLAPNLESHKMQFLRYHRGLYKEEPEMAKMLGVEIKAHDAMGDIVVLFLLFKRLLEGRTPDELVEISSQPNMISKMRFGKYRGQLISDIIKTDRAYLEWMVTKLTDLDPDVKYSIEVFLNR
ncbi:MAG: exonuclease domain-containing protein [Candidatus Cloacimonadales bacterium]